MVSELLEGSTLRDQLLRGPLPTRKALDYGIQTARGLAAAHEKGIVHRDLKPENLFLTKDGRIKILDFGLAKLTQTPHTSGPATPTLSGGTERGVVLGTVGYMAPEQVRGQVADERADLFAFGAILYEMLTGERAFHKPTSPETMSAILNEEPPSASQIVPGTPPALQKIVQRCLEKSPEQRFHSASDLAFALEALSDSGTAPTGSFTTVTSNWRWRWIVAPASAVVALVAVAVWLELPPATPVVESVSQLTNDSQTKAGSIETDGSRIYFNEGPSGSFQITQVSVNGGQTGTIPTSLVNAQIVGLTADGSSLLVTVSAPVPTQVTLWSIPLPAGDARRLGDSHIGNASLFPDGRLMYTLGNDVLTAEKDGSNPRKLNGLSTDGMAPRVSPDGKKIVFSTTAAKGQGWVINEALSDGSSIHPILTAGPGLPGSVCCLRWTSNGKYILFGGQNAGRTDIWAISDDKPLLRGVPSALRLTNGPVSYDYFASSGDAKQIFAIGAQRRGELVGYDSTAHAFLPLLGGISAYDPTFSRDGKWVAYLSYPEHTLWRSRADGSDRLQLTYPPMVVLFPRISPDGTKVAFSTAEGNVYLISMESGKSQKVIDNTLGHPTAPDWSPDGNLFVVEFGSTDAQSFGGDLMVFDIRTGKLSPVPGSKDTIGPWFLTQDLLVAISSDQSKFEVFDFKTEEWADLISSADKFANWETSPDGSYFFYETAGNNPKIFRMRIKDRAAEEVVSLKGFRPVEDPYLGNTQLNVTPDNFPVLTRDVGTQEVYALTVKWP